MTRAEAFKGPVKLKDVKHYMKFQTFQTRSYVTFGYILESDVMVIKKQIISFAIR